MEFRQKLALFFSTLLLLQELTEPVAGAHATAHRHTVTIPMGNGGIFVTGSPSVSLQKICSGSKLTELGHRLWEDLYGRLREDRSLPCSSIESMAEREAARRVDEGFVGSFREQGFDLPLWVMRRYVVERALDQFARVKDSDTRRFLEQRCSPTVNIKSQLANFDPNKYAVSSGARGRLSPSASGPRDSLNDSPADQLQQALGKAAAGLSGEGALIKMAAGAAVALASLAATMVWWRWAPIKSYVQRQYSSFRVWMDESTAKVAEKVRKFVLFERIANGLPVLTQSPWALLRKIRTRRLGLTAHLDLVYQAGINNSYPNLDVLLDELTRVAVAQNGEHRFTAIFEGGAEETIKAPIFTTDQLKKLLDVLAAPTMHPYFLDKFIRVCNLDYVSSYMSELLKHLDRQPLMVQLQSVFVLFDVGYPGEHPPLRNVRAEKVNPRFLEWIQALTNVYIAEKSSSTQSSEDLKDLYNLAQKDFEQYQALSPMDRRSTDAEIILMDTWVRHSRCLNGEETSHGKLCDIAMEQFSQLIGKRHERLARVGAGDLLFFTTPRDSKAEAMGEKFLATAARCGPYFFALAMRTYGYGVGSLKRFTDFGSCGPCQLLRDYYVKLLGRAVKDPSLMELSICLSKPKIPKGVPEIKVLSQAPAGRITVDVPLEATKEYERMDGPLQEATLRAWFTLLTGVSWNATVIAANLLDGLNKMLRSQCTEELAGRQKMPVVAVLEELDVYQPPGAA